MKILIVGGTWNDTGKPSSIINMISKEIMRREKDVTTYNGGKFCDLSDILQTCTLYDTVFWFANVDNSEPKYRAVKDVNPHCMLVTSKRNDFDVNSCEKYDPNIKRKYDMEELVQRALTQKANLCLEFSKTPTLGYDIMFRLFDPLGCVWYEGYSVEELVSVLLKRLNFLSKVTRKASIQTAGTPEFEFTGTDKEFLEFVRESGETFHKLMCLPPDVKRFVGNASVRFKQPTRCMNGFPAIRKDNIILISRRNVDKTGITEKDFVPCCLKDGDTMYMGENKPSVDSPVQLRLFEKLKNIDYILHGHCYVEGAPFTHRAVPCGAIEEVTEIFKVIKDKSKDFYVINLTGHGCLIMAGAGRISDMKSVKFYTRPMPELMYYKKGV